MSLIWRKGGAAFVGVLWKAVGRFSCEPFMRNQWFCPMKSGIMTLELHPVPTTKASAAGLMNTEALIYLWIDQSTTTSKCFVLVNEVPQCTSPLWNQKHYCDRLALAWPQSTCSAPWCLGYKLTSKLFMIPLKLDYNSLWWSLFQPHMWQAVTCGKV